MDLYGKWVIKDFLIADEENAIKLVLLQEVMAMEDSEESSYAKLELDEEGYLPFGGGMFRLEKVQ